MALGMVVALGVLAASGGVARAEVEGTAPAKVSNWRLLGAHSTTGAALMVPGPFRPEINSVLLPSSTAQIIELPYDAEVVAAYLFWSGSSPRTNRTGTPDPPDRDVDFTAADGTFYNDLSVDTDFTGFGSCVTTAALGGFYYCRRDVTDIVRAQGPGNANGIYTVGDLEADAGTLDSWDGQWVNAQAKYAGWSLILVWKGVSSQTVRRDVVLYDGFLRLDETATTAGIHSFNIGDFLVGSPALGKVSVFGMEGDRQLGVPPQDSTGCPTCYDYFAFKSQSAASPTVLSNGGNPAYNSFNSSTDVSIDIDTYYLNGLIATGDATARITMGAGDGVVDGYDNQGNGESFFVGWVIMTIDTLTPNFGGVQTRKRVLPASAGPGQTLYYIVDVVNEGSLAATGVSVRDSIPAGTTYVSGSTRVDGVPRADVGGTSPLVAGLSLGTIPTSQIGDNSRQVTFEVRVAASACGASVSNAAVVDCSELDPVTVGPAVTTIATPTLEPPTKAVSFVSAPPAGPGSTFSYTIELENSGSEPAAGLTVTDPLPPHVHISSVFTTSGTWSISGNTLTVSNISVPANNTAQVMITGRVFSVAELVAAGVAESAIDGLLISNQATISGGCVSDQATDDPAAGGFQATAFALTYAPVLSTSAKGATDLNGASLEPNDVIRFGITAANTGNRVAEVVVRDAVPANTTYVANSTRVDGVGVADVGGASPIVSGYSLGQLSYVGDNDRVITFEVMVDALVPNGAVIRNSASLEVPVQPSAGATVTSPPLTVVAAPELTTSTKTVVDVTAPIGTYRPGDLIEYTVNVTNTGNRPATGTVVTDDLSPNLTFVSATRGGAFAGGRVTWSLGNVAVDRTESVTVRARINAPLDHGTVISNRAVIDCAELDPFTTPPVQFSVTSAPLLRVTKVDEHPSLPVRPGAAVTYRIRVRNDGDMIARDVVVTDPIDASLSGVAAATGRVSSGSVVWEPSSDPRLAAIAPGAAGQIELVVTASVLFPLPNNTVVSNQATVQPTGFPAVLSDDPSLPGAADPTTFTVLSQASLAFTKSVEDLSPSTPYVPGDRVRYTLMLTAGGDAPIRDLQVTDPVDLHLTSVDASFDAGAVSGGLITWSPTTGNTDLDRLEPGDSVELVFEAAIAAGTADGTLVSNQAAGVSADLAAPIQSDGDAAAAGAQPTVFTVVARPILSFSKTVALLGDDDPQYNPGDEVRYTLTLANSGTAAATTLQVSDTFPASLTITDAAGGTVTGNTITWTVASVAAGGSHVLSPRARIAFPLDNGTRVENQALATGPDISGQLLSDDPGLGGAADPTGFVVQASPDLSNTAKSVRDLTGDALQTRPGDELEYTITVRNDGDANAHHVMVRDAVPVSSTLVATPANARLEGNALVWDSTSEARLAMLAAGGSVALTFRVRAGSPLVNGTRIANQADVQSDEITTPVPSDDPATAAVDDETVVTVVSASDLGATTKIVTDLSGNVIDEARPGQSVRYVIEVSNRGDAPATDVFVDDLLVPELIFVQAAGASYDAAMHTITWNARTGTPALAAVAPGEAVTLTFDAEIATPLDNGLQLLNQGLVSDATLRPNEIKTDAKPSTIEKEETLLTVVSSPDLTGSTKEFVHPTTGAVLTEARPGDPVRMRIRLRNSGDAAARDVRVSDVIDTLVLTNVVPQDGGSFAAGLATWSVAEIKPGAGNEVVLRLDARLRTPLDPGTLLNQALIGVGAPPTIKTDDPRLPGSEDPTALTIISAADFTTSTKDVPGMPSREVGPGQELEYSIALSNTGNGGARNVRVTDRLAPELQLVSAGDGGVFDAATATVSWSLGDIPAAQGRTVTLRVRVRAGVADGTVVYNKAVTSADGLAPQATHDPLDPGDPLGTRVTVTARPRFDVFTKEVTNLDAAVPGVLRPGDRLRYTLVLRNDGTSAATSLVVRDRIASTLVEVQQVNMPFRVEGEEILFELPMLAAGAGQQIIFDARVAPDAADGTVIDNQARVTAAEVPADRLSDDPTTPEVDDPTRIVVRYPELVVVKSFTDANGGPPEPGDEVHFSISVTNAGSVADQGVRLTDQVTPRLVLVDAGSAAVVDNTLTWSLGDLAAGDSRTLAFSVRIAEDALHGEEISNFGTVSAAVRGRVDSNVVTITVQALPRLDNLAKSVLSEAGLPLSEASPGQVLTYRIELSNEGKGAATDLEIRDHIDPYLTLQSMGNGGSIEGDEIVWRPGVLPVGESLSLELVARVAAGAADGYEILNQAFASSAELPGIQVPSDDPATQAADDPTTVTVAAEPHLAKTTLLGVDQNGGKLLPGDRVAYVLTVVNDGTIEAHSTLARLALPAYAAYLPGSTRLNGLPVPDAEGGRPPLALGLAVSSARDALEAGTVLNDDGIEPADEAAVVTFDVRIDPRAMPGTVIRTQASVSATAAQPTVSDNPATPGVQGDATVMVVGGGASLAVAKHAGLEIDVGGDGRSGVGDTLRYTIVVDNAGDVPALAATLDDPLPDNGTYVAGTLRLDDVALTDVADGDEGEVAESISVRLGDIAPGGERRVTFQVQISGGPWLSNQATVVASGQTVLSDGNPGAAGAQPTITPVDEKAEILTLDLSVADLDGGVVDPGDALRYALVIANEGAADVGGINLQLAAPSNCAVPVIIDSGTASLAGDEPPTWSIERLRPGERVRVEIEAGVRGDVAAGDVVESIATATTAGGAWETDPVRLLVGGGIGTGELAGRVYRDLGERGGGFVEGTDEGLTGFAVLLVPEARILAQGRGAATDTLAVRSVVADRDGRFRIPGVPQGRYELWSLSGEGTHFAQTDVLDVGGGTAGNRDLVVDPSGIIYMQEGGQARPVAGARVFLLDHDTGEDLPRAALRAGQQGQVTTAQGFYRFEVVSTAEAPVIPGRFRIRVEPPSTALVFPSGVLAPSGHSPQDPWGEPARAGEDGRVVPFDFPDLTKDTTYYLRFDLDADSPDFANNHLPLDRLSEHIRITKMASRRTATIGEVITYSVRIENPLDQALAIDPSGRTGGVVLEDILPAGLSWTGKAAALTVSIAGQLGESVRLELDERSEGNLLRFEPFSLPARSTVTVRYYAVVGIRAKGELENRARLKNDAGQLISNEASATVRIVEDPIFDQGTLLGRVFCDDGNGALDADEPGLPGARVYLDTGYYVDTDADGKFHFRGVPPGRHAVKLDLNTVPPASAPTTAVIRDFYLSRGLLARVNFGVRCGLESVVPTEVTLKTPTLKTPPPKPRAQVGVAPGLPGVSLDGEAQPLPLVDAVLTVADAEPDFDSGVGLNLAEPVTLTWHIRSPSRVRISRWEISLFTLEGTEVWRVAGEGNPPVRIPWELTADAMPLAPGQEYLYRVAALSPEGDLGEGGWRRVGFRVGAPKAAEPESLAEWRGALFAGETDKPTPELVGKVNQLVAQLVDRPAFTGLTVEAHEFSSRKRSANLLLSARRASAVKQLLVEAGLSEEMVRPIGKGDTVPVMPNVTNKARELNTRLAVSLEAPAFETGPLPPVAYPGWLTIAESPVQAAAERVDREVEVEPGTVVAVDLRHDNGRRVRVARAYPFTRVGAGEQGTVEIPVSGSFVAAQLALGDARVALPLLSATCAAAPVALSATPEGLTPPARIELSAAAPLRSWMVRVFNPEGSLLKDIAGDGAPPAEITWDGRNDAGHVVVRPGMYTFRCLMTDADGNRAVSAAVKLPVSLESNEQRPTQVLSKEQYPDAQALQPEVLAKLGEIAAAVVAAPGSRVHVEVHDHADGGKMQAQIRTARLADALKKVLLDKGVPDEALDLAALGATKPLMIGSGRRAVEANRRVLLEVYPPPSLEPPPVATPSVEPPQRRVRVAGVEMALVDDGTFSGKVVVEKDATLVVDVANGDGHTAVYNIPLFEGRPLDSAVTQVPRGFQPAAGEPHLGSKPESLVGRPAVAAAAAAPAAVEMPALNQSLSGEGDVDAITGWAPEMPSPHLASPSDPARLVEPSDPARLVEPNDLARPATPSEQQGTQLAERAPVAPAEQAPVAASMTVPLEGAPATLAADLSVWLPPDGAELQGERLTVRGHTDGRNLVRVNGEAVAVDEHGRFVRTLVLQPGEAKIEVVAEDPDGNSARVTRTYRVPAGEWFLLAMADTAAGFGHRLEGMNEDTTLDVDSGRLPAKIELKGIQTDLSRELYLHGRGVVYFKGRAKGSSLFDANPFEEVRLTVHADSGREEEADLLKELVDPEKYYPVYGDSAEEVQDVSTREKVYVLLQADRSRLTLGNFSTQIDGIELFRFHRTYFGASLDVDHAFADGYRTEAHAFAASGARGVRHRALALQGTGGSMFFLRDGALVEGSERVEIVVRDPVTGMRLVARPQVRDVDYTISYREGRLVFSQPVASTAGPDTTWRLDQNPLSTLDGAPVFVEVEYDYAASMLDDGEKAFAAQLKQTFFDRVTVGGGIVDEDRTQEGGSQYRLYGVEARVRLLERTQIDVELAYSQARDAEHLVSTDGGITYGVLGSEQRFRIDDAGNVSPREIAGRAARVQIAGDVGEIIGWEQPEPPAGVELDAPPEGAAKTGAAVKPPPNELAPYLLYFQHQDPQFFSGSTILEQGQTKLGGQVRALLTEKDSIRVRHDGVWSKLYFGDEERLINRQMSVAGYERDEKSWKAGLEIGHTYLDDRTRAVNSDAASIYGEMKVLPRLVLLAEQEGILRGDDRVLQSWGDQLVTSAGARYQLAEALWLTAMESVRWSGINSTQIGLKTKLGEDLSFYATERLSAGQGRTMTTTVLGGESSTIPGSRSYAEYQLDTLASGRSGRAVFGMDNRWTVLEGLQLSLAYERSQLLGTRPSAPAGYLGSSLDTPTASGIGSSGGYGSSSVSGYGSSGVSGYGSSAVGREQQFSASGYSSSPVFPAGVASRDAFSVGVEYLRARTFKAAARLELRYDRGEQAYGTPDRMMLFGQAGGDWRLDRNLVVLGRARGASVSNLSLKSEVLELLAEQGDSPARGLLGFAEGQFLDVSVGMALRPVHSDAVEALFKWTRRFERRAVNPELTQFQLEVSDVLSLEPAFELGFGLQGVGKAAVKFFEVADADLATVRSTTLLGLLRLNYHVLEVLDAGIEYRWLGNFLTQESEHGPLVELAWIPVEYVSVGVGYNFTHFSADLLDDDSLDQHGVFLRVTGKY